MVHFFLIISEYSAISEYGAGVVEPEPDHLLVKVLICTQIRANLQKDVQNERMLIAAPVPQTESLIII